MKNVDTKTNNGVGSPHLLETGKDGNRTRSYTEFLCPAFKGVLGVGGNILNTVSSSLTVSKLPALHFCSQFEKLRGYTMKTEKKNLIRTLAYDAARDLALLRDIFQKTPTVIQQNPNSIGFLFTGIECRLASINFQIVKGVHQ